VEAVNMSTVEENMRKYTKREVEKAKEARELQEKMNFPAPNVMIEMVKRHMDNCPVTIQDIHRAMDIWVQVLQILRVRRLNRSRVFLERKNSCQGV
jgi:multidrug efflux pump subunit AcrB